MDVEPLISQLLAERRQIERAILSLEGRSAQHRGDDRLPIPIAPRLSAFPGRLIGRPECVRLSSVEFRMKGVG